MAASEAADSKMAQTPTTDLDPGAAIRRYYKLASDECGVRGLKGMVCLTKEDVEHESVQKASTLYGEVMPAGVVMMLDKNHLNVGTATSLADLGGGVGKLAMQAYLQHGQLLRVTAVELVRSRFAIAAAAFAALAASDTQRYTWTETSTVVRVSERRPAPAHSCGDSKEGLERVLEMRLGSLFDAKDLLACDVVICETEVPDAACGRLIEFLSGCKSGSRLMTYRDLRAEHAKTSKDQVQVQVQVQVRVFPFTSLVASTHDYSNMAWDRCTCCTATWGRAGFHFLLRS